MNLQQASASSVSKADERIREMKSYNHLYEGYISDENIKTAIKNVCKHKTTRKDFRDLHDNPDKYIEWIRSEAVNFRNSKHTPMHIYDGIQRKRRTIIVPSFREQIIHHMVVNVLKPVFLRPMYQHSYGSIPGRGAHLAKKHIEKTIRKGHDIKYCLKMDIRKYFESIPHDILKQRLSDLIHDKKFLAILFEIIDVVDEGIPLGFYTSQWLANFYLTDLDHYIKEILGAKHYYRYMDDMVIFGSNKRKLHEMRKAIECELEKNGLKMKDNWQVFRFHYTRNDEDHGRFLDFMGFRLYRNRTTLRRSIAYKATRKARSIFKKDKPTIYDIRQILSYLGWIDATDTYGMYLKYIKPIVDFGKLKKRVSKYDKRRYQNEICEIRERYPA